MSEHSHQDHHVSEKKPVSFTVPFILACATLLVIFLFLSLCNPKPHHGHEAAGHHNTEVGTEHHETMPSTEAVESHETEVTEPAHKIEAPAEHSEGH
jgi:hypothetical protein